jgi:hypothetical protein
MGFASAVNSIASTLLMSELLTHNHTIPDHLQRELTCEIEDSTLVACAQATRAEYLGVISPEGMTDMIARARRAFMPNSFFGYRLGHDVSFIVNVDAEREVNDFPAIGGDLYATDTEGYCKNNLLDSSALQRMEQAKQQGHKTILVFGGSTVMGVGSRKPNYTIPALLERVLKEQHGMYQPWHLG